MTSPYFKIYSDRIVKIFTSSTGKNVFDGVNTYYIENEYPYELAISQIQLVIETKIKPGSSFDPRILWPDEYLSSIKIRCKEALLFEQNFSLKQRYNSLSTLIATFKLNLCMLLEPKSKIYSFFYILPIGTQLLGPLFAKYGFMSRDDLSVELIMSNEKADQFVFHDSYLKVSFVPFDKKNTFVLPEEGIGSNPVEPNTYSMAMFNGNLLKRVPFPVEKRYLIEKEKVHVTLNYIEDSCYTLYGVYLMVKRDSAISFGENANMVVTCGGKKITWQKSLSMNSIPDLLYSIEETSSSSLLELYGVTMIQLGPNSFGSNSQNGIDVQNTQVLVSFVNNSNIDYEVTLLILRSTKF